MRARETDYWSHVWRAAPYLQRGRRRGWVHYSRDGIAHVTTRDWALWLRSWFRATP